MELLQQVLVFSTVGYTFLLTDTDNIGNGTYTDVTQFTEKNLTDFFLQKCESHNVSDFMESLKEKLATASKCSSKYVNVTSLEKDLRQAMETKTVDLMFQRYCDVWGPFIGCLNGTISVLEQCLDEDEKYQVDMTLDILDYMQVTLCSHGAIKFRQFYKEGGLDYVQEEWGNIKKCIDTQKSIPRMLRKGDCQDFEEIRKCISNELSNFNKTGPAEVIDDMFELVVGKFCNGTSESSTSAPPSSGDRSSVRPVLLLAMVYVGSYI